MSIPNITDSDSVSDDGECSSAFDRLPDDVVMLIFNKLLDAKSLSLCAAICKRFRCLIAQTHSVLLSVPPCTSKSMRNSMRNHPLIAFANKLVIKPFASLLRAIKSKAAFSSAAGRCTCRNTVNDGDYYYSPAHVLRNFREIRRLEIRLPSRIACVDEVGAGGSAGSAMRWMAEVGSELRSCVIVGGTEICPVRKNCSGIGDEGEGSREELGISENEELKLRIVWTISCLIAASARHSLLREVMNDHLTVRDVTVTDETGQGRVTMNAEQIEEMRRNSYTKKTDEEDDECVVMVNDRTRVPALKMKMWIAPELELPGEGCVIKGATLVAIRPVEEWSTSEKPESAGILDLVRKMEHHLLQKEDRLFAEAANKLVKLKRSYTLEMNSF